MNQKPCKGNPRPFDKPLQTRDRLRWQLSDPDSSLETALDVLSHAPEWLTIKQVALELGLHSNTIYSMVKRGDLEAFRYNRRVIRIHRTSLMALLTRYQGGEWGTWREN